MHGKVLVTDAHWNKSVAAIRSLSLAGLDVGISETSRLAAGMFSRYPTERFLTPSPICEPDQFIKDILFIVREFQPDVLMPMELTTLLLISEHRHKIGSQTKFPFAPHPILLQAASKIEATKAARNAGLKPPPSAPITASSAPHLIDELGPSLVLKPDFGEGGRGVLYTKGQAELSKALNNIPDDGTYLAQQRIAKGGAGLGVSILMDERQQVLASFCHKRIREYPVSGGPSSCREAISHPQATRDAITLLTSLHFEGVAMVEFKEDPATGKALFLEINPRFWGSLPLAIKSGVDFPSLLYKWARGLRVTPPRVKIGTRVRNILPGEMLHFIGKKGRVDRSFWTFANQSDDLFCLHDPFPPLARMLSPLLALYDPQLKSVFKKRS